MLLSGPSSSTGKFQLAQLPFLAQPVRLTLVVMVDDLEPEVGVSLHEGRPDVRDVVAPAPAVLAVHVVLALVVLEPIELVEPVGPEAAPFAGRGGRGSAAGSSAIRGRFRGLAGRDRGSRFHRSPEDLLQEGFFGGSGGAGSGGRGHRRIGTGRSTGLTLLLLLLLLESVPVGELAGAGRGRVGDDRNCTLGQLELVLTGSRRLELVGQGRKEGLLLLALVVLLLLEQVLVERFLLDGSCGGRG